ncbi:hypothetical protein OPQ81_008915 [Rhizoctonia solani]|nr:hypothetical protein OPQ81_008915 [Rhizoctonia solani]
MVSVLWNACAAEVQDLETVQQQLKEPGVDLEIKDHAGTTPLIQAVRNGHKDVIKALLAAGADINNASSQGKPETYTTDPEILALLQAKSAPAQPAYEGYPQSSDPNTPYDPALMQHYYYPPPPGHEGHYPPYPYPMMPPSEGQPPMPPFPPQGDGNSPGGVHNLPTRRRCSHNPLQVLPLELLTLLLQTARRLPSAPPPFSPGSATPYSANAPYTPGPVPIPYAYPRSYTEAPKEAPVNAPVNGTTEETQPAPAANGINGAGNHPNGGFIRRNGRGGRPDGAGMGMTVASRMSCLNLELRPRSVILRTIMGDSTATVLVNRADDFPVLKGGSASDRPTPAASTNGNGNGLTAAQVLQAPAPAKKGKADSEVVGDLADALSKVHVNGLPTPAFEAPSTTPEISAVGA